GLTNESRAGYSSCAETTNGNVIAVVSDNWPYQVDALAQTAVTYNNMTGVIVDADIELNDERFSFGVVSQSGQPFIDIQNTIAHESGHFIGLDHTSVFEATMYASAPAGQTSKRDLHQDDVDALCEAYPGNEELVCEDATAGFYSAPSIGPGDKCETGCGCSSASTRHDGALLWVLGVAWIGWFRRRRA
ncbi:MAG: matrixin family metalloprotease, partial [Myxococcales bacterium]|nr:matrixin family metalloprotease [Myxococcales bacterium]